MQEITGLNELREQSKMTAREGEQEGLTATTGSYRLRDVPHDLRRAARVRAVRESTTLRWVLRQALREYVAGSWTPQADAK
jgi:hypothetical protein